MTDIAIRVEGLGKKYTLSHSGAERYTALRDVLARQAKRILTGWRRLDGRRASFSAAPSKEDFWALRDVSFQVSRGQRLGIIGRNGAGKSTLLKLLSRITEPTEGRITLRGRTASLLEVGTGFHPELTGRENIYLNGGILGMTRAEIRSRFESIVDFAEVSQFLDTPVKRYSSGMYVRLAFSVAAHLDPEILLVDEVLAVGDAQFQEKCLGKMHDFSLGGRTILFVSHNMNAIEDLCDMAIILDRGAIRECSQDVRAVIKTYILGSDKHGGPSEMILDEHLYANPWFTPSRFAITGNLGQTLEMPIRNDQQAWVNIEGNVHQLDPAFNVGYALFNDSGDLLFWSLTTDGRQECWPAVKPGKVKLRTMLPQRLLNEGYYRLEMIASLHCRQWLVEPGSNSPSIQLHIQGGLSDSPYWRAKRPGLLAPNCEWESWSG